MIYSLPRRSFIAFGVIVVTLSALAAWLLIAATASAAVVLVNGADPTPDGSGCGSVVNPCNTIQAGVNNAAAGDVIVVAPGTYPETAGLDVNKTVTIQGANAGVDPRTTSCAPVLPQTIITHGIQVSANNVVIKDITEKKVKPHNKIVTKI